MTDLLNETIAAHGGMQRWSELSSIIAHVKGSGALWPLKGQPGIFSDIDMDVDTHTERVTATPFIHEGWRGIFERDRVSVESAGGQIVEQREHPRASFEGHNQQTPWDHLHALYFGGYAIWTYLTVPFILTQPGFVVTEIDPWTENGQTWRRLQVVFPERIASHCTEQTLYVDGDGLIRRHDYNAQVVGGIPSALYLNGHKDFGGIIFSTLRQVFARQPDNHPATETVLVNLEFDSYTPRSIV